MSRIIPDTCTKQGLSNTTQAAFAATDPSQNAGFDAVVVNEQWVHAEVVLVCMCPPAWLRMGQVRSISSFRSWL